MTKLISTGEFADHRNWRIEKVNGMYYYDVECLDWDTCQSSWCNVFRHFDIAPVLQARNDDQIRIEKLVAEKIKPYLTTLRKDGV